MPQQITVFAVLNDKSVAGLIVFVTAHCSSTAITNHIPFIACYSYSYTLQRIVLRGIMQCYRLVGKDGFSALIGIVGD